MDWLNPLRDSSPLRHRFRNPGAVPRQAHERTASRIRGRSHPNEPPGTRPLYVPRLHSNRGLSGLETGATRQRTRLRHSVPCNILHAGLHGASSSRQRGIQLLAFLGLGTCLRLLPRSYAFPICPCFPRSLRLATRPHPRWRRCLSSLVRGAFGRKAASTATVAESTTPAAA